MKTMLSPRILATLLLYCVVATLQAATVEFTVNGIFYHGFDDKNATVWNHSSYSTLTSATIPKTVSYNNVTYTVTIVANEAFKNATKLKTVSVPSTVTKIGKQAFYGCTALTTVTLASGPTELGTEAFRGCTALTAITIPSTITAIPDNAFYGCTALKTATLPSTLQTIGSTAFGGCGLTAITIPENVTAVKPGAFINCTSLAKVTWNAINSADQNGNTSTFNNTFSPFQNCPVLKTFTFGSKVEHIPSYLCHSLTGLTEVTIPASVTSLGYGIFACCSNLKKVTYNAVNAYYRMGSTYYNLTFYECGNLTTVTFGSNVELIPGTLLQRCKRIKSITVPAKVTTVGAAAFAECDSLTKVVWNAKACAGPYDEDSGGPFCFNAYLVNNSKTITTFTFGEGVEEIPSYLCYSMSGITSLTMPSTLKKIGRYAFNGCSFKTISLPAGVTTVDDYAFSSCGITSLTLPAALTTIGRNAFAGNSFTTLNIPASVTSIGTQAFRNVPLETITVAAANSVYDSREGANVLVETATSTILKGNVAGHIPNSTPIIGEYAYDRLSCENLEIPASVTTLRSYAFSITTLKTLAIPASVTTIGNGAFSMWKYATPKIETIRCYNADPTAISCNVNAFTGLTDRQQPPTCRLIVPVGTEELYAATSPWSDFTVIDVFNPADLNGDTVANTGDVSALYAAILGMPYSVQYDLNADGVVNTADVSALYDILLR